MLRMPFPSQHVSIGTREFQGFLDCPEDARALVLFVHERGCGRHNPEDNQIATALHKLGFATLLVDLFDPKEQYELSASAREAKLPARIAEVIDWALSAPALKGLALHCVGSGDIADPLLRTMCTPGRSIGRVVLLGPPCEPDAELLGQAPPTLVLDKAGRVSLDPEGKARLQAAARSIAEWIGRTGDGSTTRDCVPGFEVVRP